MDCTLISFKKYYGLLFDQMVKCSGIVERDLVGPIYDWWTLYGRMFDGERHRKAVTNRPALLEGVARMTKSGGRRTLKGSLQHEKSGEIQELIFNVMRTLQKLSAITEG